MNTGELQECSRSTLFDTNQQHIGEPPCWDVLRVHQSIFENALIAIAVIVCQWDNSHDTAEYDLCIVGRGRVGIVGRLICSPKATLKMKHTRKSNQARIMQCNFGRCNSGLLSHKKFMRLPSITHPMKCPMNARQKTRVEQIEEVDEQQTNESEA